MKVVIVGGGISGLAIAYVLTNKKNDIEVTIIEAEDRPGGKIWSEQVEGFLCEKGPNGFLDNKPKTLELCHSLGLDPVRGNENSKKRFIFSNGKLKALPESPLSFIKSDILSWSGKLRLLLELNAPKGPEDESIADFITRRLGSEALEKLIDPMVSGIYAGDPYRMSIKNCFPRIKELEQEYGSLIKALFKIRKQRKDAKGSRVSAAPGGTLTSFYNGTQTITDALAEKLGDKLKLGVRVHGITRERGQYRLHTSENVIDADIVVLASPAFASAEILRDFDRELSATLSAIPYPHVSVVSFGYKKEKVEHSLKGFGFLIPRREKLKILGTLWDSSIFPNRAPEGYVLLRTMIGGAQNPEIASLDNNRLIDSVFNELKSILGLRSEPEMVRIYRWEKAIPQYILGHSKILQAIDEKLKNYPGLYLTGNAYRGIGINDCVENAYKLADKIIEINNRGVRS
jgi:oxygen-dependent protoporphyrinogen oxidase